MIGKGGALLSVGRIKGILERSEQARVLVVGDLMLDRYVSGSVTRISPESPVPVVQVDKEWVGVGGAANVAANVVAWVVMMQDTSSASASEDSAWASQAWWRSGSDRRR